MFFKVLKYSIPIILLLSIIRGSALSIAELTAQHSEHVIRQTKAEQMLRYMNESVDPCEDFYEFTCGNYVAHNPLGPMQRRLSPMDAVHREMASIIKTMLDTDDLADTYADKQVKNYYRSCMHVPNPKYAYRDKLVEVIDEFGKMPILEGDSWQESDFDWMTTVAAIVYRTGLQNTFGIDVSADLEDNTKNCLYIAMPAFPLKHRSVYVDKDFPEQLYERQGEIAYHLAVYLGVEKQLAIETSREILQFETALAQGLIDPKLGQKATEINTLVPFNELQRKYMPQVDFKSFIGAAIGFTPDEVRVVPQYIENTLQVLANTTKREAANYILYTLVENFMVESFEDTKVQEQSCMTAVRETFSANLENMLYRKFVTTEIEQGLYRMWREMKKTFGEVLQSSRLNWMHGSTRKQALEKLKALKLKVNSHEKNNFTQEFAQLNLKDNDYVGNHKAVLLMSAPKNRPPIEEPPQATDNGVRGSFTPSYIAAENTVTLPVGNLKPYYLWSHSYPNAYNFASLGSLIGHEIVHGFDNQGRHYNALGNECDWWDTQSASEFGNRMKCFVDQYKSYIYDGISLPESQRQEENIADNGGVRLAYEALRNLPKSERIAFPGFEAYTDNQLFFISYGQQWCVNYSPEFRAIQAATDTHVPEKFRVIGPLSNFKEFAKEFRCPRGSSMNPVQKCKIY